MPSSGNKKHQCRVEKASATETVDLGSIPGQAKPKAIHSFPA